MTNSLKIFFAALTAMALASGCKSGYEAGDFSQIGDNTDFVGEEPPAEEPPAEEPPAEEPPAEEPPAEEPPAEEPPAEEPPAEEPPRAANPLLRLNPNVVVLTDIGQDPDDQQSFVRFLLYTNEMNVKGLIATANNNSARSVQPKYLRDIIDAYAKDLSNLRMHDPNYPSASTLKALIRSGSSERKHGAGLDSEGSNFLIDVVDDSKEPVWVVVWGGKRDLAQALYKVQKSRSSSKYKEFQKKLRVYSIDINQGVDEPENTGTWIKNNAKDMFLIASDGGDNRKEGTYRGVYMLGDRSMQNKSWCTANIQNHGYLGDKYPLNTTETGMKEGDTPSFLYLISNGLNNPKRPDWGGWGGRYRLEQKSSYPNMYIGIRTEDELNGRLDRRNTVARWRPAFQADFQARIDWTVSNFSQANHPPVPLIQGAIERTVEAGDRIQMDASATTDPDGDRLSYRWWVYEEASSFGGTVQINASDKEVATLNVPSSSAGKTIHVIVEVKDNGVPALTRYARILFHVKP